MQVTFVSNYINHHQIPFSNAMLQLTGGHYCFIQTEPMEKERVTMGWGMENLPPYVHCYYEEEQLCRKLILDSDIVLFGGCEDETFIEERLKEKKPVIRYSERLYKEAQWKAISPRGIIKKYHDHTSHNNDPVYLLCAGGYVASDFHIVRAYPGKMFCWGYFPETKHYDLDELMAGKGWNGVPYLLWAARMIDWKHAERAIAVADYLKKNGISFHLDMIGDGPERSKIEEMVHQLDLVDVVSLLGMKPPAMVREYMEKADVQLITSDRMEGWGAVVNESMNSGCVPVVDHMVGAAPYLVKNRENGVIYESGNIRMLQENTVWILRNKDKMKQMGRKAYLTITETWNAEKAAENLYLLLEKILEGDICQNREVEEDKLYPCAPAPVISERSARRQAHMNR